MQYPARCVSEDPEELWRDDAPDEGGAECPVYLGRQFERFFFGWNLLDKGLLPVSGGWEEQPHYWVQALEIIGAALGHVQREQVEQMKQAAQED